MRRLANKTQRVLIYLRQDGKCALRGLELSDPNKATTLDRAMVLGKHGGDRKSEKVKDQGDNITLKERGTSTDYTVARLDRDRPDLAAHVRAGHMSANAAAIEAGFRHKPTPFETVKRLWPKLTASEKSTIYSIDR